MGQASSRGAQDSPRLPNRVRPTSWAATPNSPPPGDGEGGHVALQPLPQFSSRRGSQRFNPFNILSSGRSDAGPSSPSSVHNLTRRRSRITRARSSLSTSIPSLLRRRTSVRHQNEPDESSSLALTLPTPSQQESRHPISPHNRSPFLPEMPMPDLDLNFDDLPNTLNRSGDDRIPRLTSSRREGRSSIIPSLRPERGIRSMTSSLRGRRRSPLRQNEDQAAMLSRLLSVAAAATAASLMGDDHRAVSEARNVAGDGEDGTFDSFLQALQNGRIASALRQGNSDNSEEGSDSNGGSPAPLNFFRMFRFGSGPGRRTDASTRSGSRGSGLGPTANNNGEEEDGDGRMVPIIIVGIRSINPGTGTPQDDNIPPFLDALSSFPTPLTSPGDNTIDGILRQPQNGTRFSHRRRASMGGINPFPANYDSQRSHRTSERPRPWSTFTDSPSGPLPPPSTPASSGLSAVSSGATTPTMSASPPSPVTLSNGPSRRGSFLRRAAGPELESTAEEPRTQQRTPRQRRLSESDFTTRFGSGSARRNGVVEPDHNPGEGSRSWIIYVLGGSYPENHPILTTPSLFTDSPTYEDMLLLSTLLGPAKPPVASEEDVAAAPGLYRIRNDSGVVVAVAVEGEDVVTLAGDARCLVCLCDFEIDEEARKLMKCGHLFHRECIDQWLTTGRNSCPLCRGEGVVESSAEASPSNSEPATPTTTPPVLAESFARSSL